MPASTRSKDPHVYVLDFFYDEDDACALTARINDQRLHIIVNPKRFEDENGADEHVQKEYMSRLEAIKISDKKAAGEEESSDDGDASDHSQVGNDETITRCVCGATGDKEGLTMVRCGSCGVWQHNVCMEVTEASEEPRKSVYNCEKCRPDEHKELLAAMKNGDEPWHARKDNANANIKTNETTGSTSQENSDVKRDHDSGIFMGTEQEDAKLKLQNWILSNFTDDVDRLSKLESEPKEISIADWYNAPTSFFEVEIKDSRLFPVQVEKSSELQGRMDKLLPSLHIPKWIQKMNIPMIDPNSVTVLETSDNIDPVHPSMVRYKDEEYFFKPVEPDKVPTKREIQMLQRIEQLGLSKQINVPKLHGLIASTKSSKTSIIGLLLTKIVDAIPLTTLMTPDVSASKRAAYAADSQRTVQILHDNDIIWGDAKGDNFVVDAEDKLWVIDFGGSYTEGWVDPELMETLEGDDAGLEKVMNGLKDPLGMTFDPEEEGNEDIGKKRGREEDADGEGEALNGNKRAKHGD